MKALLSLSSGKLALKNKPKPVSSDPGDAIAKIMVPTANKGVEVAIETIGIPANCDICQAIVNAGGHNANIGGVQLNRKMRSGLKMGNWISTAANRSPRKEG